MFILTLKDAISIDEDGLYFARNLFWLHCYKEKL